MEIPGKTRAKLSGTIDITAFKLTYPDGRIYEFVGEDARSAAIELIDRPGPISAIDLLRYDLRQRGLKPLEVVDESTLSRAAHYGEASQQCELSTNIDVPRAGQPVFTVAVQINFNMIVRRVNDS
jgi:hypothetical protein